MSFFFDSQRDIDRIRASVRYTEQATSKELPGERSKTLPAPHYWYYAEVSVEIKTGKTGKVKFHKPTVDITTTPGTFSTALVSPTREVVAVCSSLQPSKKLAVGAKVKVIWMGINCWDCFDGDCPVDDSG